VELSNGEGNLSTIEFHSRFTESLLALEYLVQLSTLDERHNKVKSELRLEEEFHADKERMVCSKEDILLKQGALDLVMLYKDIFPNSFDSVELLVQVEFCQVHASEGSSADLLLDVEVVESDVGGLSGMDDLRRADVLSKLVELSITLFVLLVVVIVFSSYRHRGPILSRVEVERVLVLWLPRVCRRVETFSAFTSHG